jgi:hypothetical protein
MRESSNENEKQKKSQFFNNKNVRENGKKDDNDKLKACLKSTIGIYSYVLFFILFLVFFCVYFHHFLVRFYLFFVCSCIRVFIVTMFFKYSLIDLSFFIV